MGWILADPTPQGVIVGRGPTFVQVCQRQQKL
jgi:hypothetical protein